MEYKQVFKEFGFRVSNSIALRSEIGIDVGTTSQNYYGKTYFMASPIITLEPRWYYNLKKREGKSKRIDANSGNFVSLKTSYHPDLVISTNS